MAVGEGSNEPDEHDETPTKNGPPSTAKPPRADEESEEEDDDEEEDEPRLKYATLTKNLSSLYRNGDASSTFFVAGDKMARLLPRSSILNANDLRRSLGLTTATSQHVLSLPAFQSLKIYHAHSASISAISISPFPPPLPTIKLDAAQRLAAESAENSDKASPTSPTAKGSPRPGPVPAIPSNQIYIATSSIDGNVCVASLVDAKDVQLRNFARPVQAIALSPEYKSDRNYLSGGQAGSLILTSGGQTGRSANATTTGATAAASGWLGSIGLGANTGTDKVLHSGEGVISTIKWSLSGKYVLWVNEQGIKIMRSNLHLEGSDSGLEWKRFSHIDRPNRAGWEDMAGVWKARAEWISRDSLESDEDSALARTASDNGNDSEASKPVKMNEKIEEVSVGWGDTVWLIKVYPHGTAGNKAADGKKAGHAEVATIIRFNDCTISGVSLYTPNLLLVLAYMENKEDLSVKKVTDGSTRKGRHNRQNGLKPELRLVDINSNEEVDTDTLSISRYETLSASDYHLGVLSPVRIPAALAQRGYLGALGSGMSTIGSGVGAVGSGIYTGVEVVGQGVWDATLYPTRMLGANRLFSSSDSIRSGKVGSEKTSSGKGMGYLSSWIPSFGTGKENEQLNDVATTQGLKIFIFSPYDCIVAVKRNLADRLQWLTTTKHYGQAWNLLDEHPEAVGPSSETSGTSSPPTPSKASSVAKSSSITGPPAHVRQQATLEEFFADSSSIASFTKLRNKNSSAEKEKRRIGELWLQQLVSTNQWSEAGEVAGKVLNTSTRWEHWIWTFVRSKKFDEISPVVPTFQLMPPLPSLIFEIILGHYVSVDRKHFRDLLDQWPSDLFDISSISNAIEDQLQSETAPKESTDWRILQECLAKLYLADGRFKEALRCYVQLQDADTAMAMIKEHHLVDAVADDLPGLVLLRISPEQLRSSSKKELEDLSSEPIKLLVDEATHGVVEPEQVVIQLEESKNLLFLFFYFRALWRGEGTTQKASAPRVSHLAAITSLAADEGKALVEQFADTAVELFSEYDRELLMEFLHTSTSYTFEKAMNVCERHHFIPELVYLLSKTGQLKRALFLIIEELQDVSKAIAFAKAQDDKGLWDDLLEYSMSRPRFISGLLAEVGTAIDPITLVKRIPSGLEIEGLKDGLKKMIREYDLQDSISLGAAKVMSSEVAVSMDTLRRGRRKGVKFNVSAGSKKTKSRENGTVKEAQIVWEGEEKSPAQRMEILPGHCAGCLQAFAEDETETLVGFACGHVYHLSHLLCDAASPEDDPALPPDGREADTEDHLSSTFTRTVGPKVTSARLLKDKIQAAGGCRICKAHKMMEVD